MPINRAPFNALVDDDGSGTTGTPWNKSQIAGVLLDPIDGMWTNATGDLIFGTNATIARGTLDGADTGYLTLTGGHVPSGSIAEGGGTIRVYGNEVGGGLAGSTQLFCGTVAGARLEVVRGNGAVAASFDTMRRCGCRTRASASG